MIYRTFRIAAKLTMLAGCRCRNIHQRKTVPLISAEGISGNYKNKE